MEVDDPDEMAAHSIKLLAAQLRLEGELHCISAVLKSVVAHHEAVTKEIDTNKQAQVDLQHKRDKCQYE